MMRIGRIRRRGRRGGGRFREERRALSRAARGLSARTVGASTSRRAHSAAVLPGSPTRGGLGSSVSSGCQIKGRPRFMRDDGVSPGRPPPENGAFARDATYLGAFRDARVFRGGDLRVVKGRRRSATATRPSRRASAAEGSRTRCDVVRGGNAGGVRLGARRERRRTMMGDSYFTSVSTGGIGMAPGLLRRKRPARRSLFRRRARLHCPLNKRRSESRSGLPRLRAARLQSAEPRKIAYIVVCEASHVWAFTLALSFDLHLVPRWPLRWRCARAASASQPSAPR